jgi:hypothetical protein
MASGALVCYVFHYRSLHLTCRVDALPLVFVFSVPRDEKQIGKIPVEKYMAPDGELVQLPSVFARPGHPLCNNFFFLSMVCCKC